MYFLKLSLVSLILFSFIFQVRKCQELADCYLLQEKLGLRILQADSGVDTTNIALYQARKELNRMGNNHDSEKKRYLLGKQVEAELDAIPIVV